MVKFHDPSPNMEPREGIEPPIGDYKSPVIPFNYRGNKSLLPKCNYNTCYSASKFRHILKISLLHSNFITIDRNGIKLRR